MKKTYQMLLVLALVMLGATNAVGQKIYRAELDKSMFKAWDGCGAEVNEVTPESYVGKESKTVEFECDANFFKELGGGTVVFGNGNVYYKWYANLTGTKKFYFTGTKGVQLRILMNRVEPVEGSDDPNGGTNVEKNVTIGDDGTAVLDVSDLEFVHLNAIKTGWGSPAGVVKSIEIEGTVKPVTGILSWINNGDAEGDDLASFPVSLDGPNNGSTAPDEPEIVAGGVSGKCFKVVAFDQPTETWHTQFYIKADDVIAKGTKWKLKMSIKASEPTKITTSAQAAPRTWKGGFINEFTVSDQWQNYEWSGEIGVDDFQSIAFDLNNGNERNAKNDGWLPGNANVAFYFDNIEFGEDLGGANPMSDISLAYGADVVCVNLAGNTNMKKLVEAKGVTITKGVQSLIFDNSCATVTWNGKPCTLASVEGRLDGNLYIFIDDNQAGGFDATDANVVVAFTNPEDADHHLTFTEGRWAGKAVPDFSGLVCDYQESLGKGSISSYLYAPSELVSANPENGSFNLPADLKEFKVTFTQPVDVTTVHATLDGEALTVSPAEGFADVVTLTRTGDAALAGVKQLVIATGVDNVEGYPTEEDIIVKYSFGNSQTSEEVVAVYEANFTTEGANAYAAGWKVNQDGSTTDGVVTNDGTNLQDANTGSGCRLMHNQSAFVADLLYLCQRESNPRCPSGVALYGIVDGYKLALEAKDYHLTLDAAQWDRDNDRSLLVQVLPLAAVDADHGTVLDEDAILVQERKAITPKLSTKEAVHFDLTIPVKEAGNYVIRMVPGDKDGKPNGFADGCAIGNIKVVYLPDVMGIVEMTAMATALENAKKVRDDNGDKGVERYAGAAYTALDNLITEYDGKVMTTPTAYTEGANKLDEAAKALKDHRTTCDTYDTQVAQAQALVDDNADKKFANTNFYSTLKATAAKYIVEKTDEGYTFKVLTDDDELVTAASELLNVVNIGKALFTEGKSTPENSNGGKGTGIAVETERLRLGVEGLKALGVAEDDALLVKANNALTDDDALAEDLMLRTKHALYGKLKDNENIFQKTTTTQVANPDYNPENPVEGVPEFIDETETVAVCYDMTVFVKNPNIYKQEKNMNFTPENVPAWSVPEGYNAPGMTVGWGTPKNYDQVAEDCMLSNWGAAYRVEQTITDLPAGKYTVSFGFGERQDEASNADNLVYAKTSTEEEFTAQPKVIGQAFPFADGTNATSIEDIEVTDGILTIGVNAGQGSHVFFNDVRIILTGAADVDYASLYEALPEMPTAIETLEGTPAAKVRAIEMFDLNGRRVTKAQKGLVIMKQIMSDGTVRTQKVVK